MADIDPTNPTDSSIVSQFPANERASRAAIETNFYKEHAEDNGRHEFGVGNDAARDAITDWVVGGLWMNTSRTPVKLQRVVSIDPDVWEDVERTGAQIKTAYEAESDTNAFTDALLSKLNGIAAGAASTYRGHISGLQISHFSGDTVNDIEIAIGTCAPDNIDTVSTPMNVAAAFSKRIDANWVVGDTNGGFPSTLSLTDSTWYHVFLIKRTDTGVVDAGFDTSLTAANLLTDASDYDAYRRIGSVARVASANLPFVQSGDHFYLVDASPTALTDPAEGDIAVTTPLGVRCIAKLLQVVYTPNATAGQILIQPTDADTAADSATLMTAGGFQGTGTASGDSGRFSAPIEVLTSTSSSVSYQDGTGGTVTIITTGWEDFRGKN